MKKKPFVWFRVNRSIRPDWLKDFNKNMHGNAGLVMTRHAIEKNGPEILMKINSELKIPLAFIISDKSELQYKIPDLFFKKMISPGAKNLKYLLSNEDYDPCYSLVFPKNQGLDINKLLSELLDYFDFKVFFPSREATIAFYPENENIITELLRKMVNLGISSFLVFYSKKNVETLSHCLMDDRIGINTGTSDNPKIFNEWRSRIDILDDLLIETISKRLEIVREMGAYKTQHNLPLFEADRWRRILISREKNAILKNVDQGLIGQIFEAIHLSGLKKMLED